MLLLCFRMFLYNTFVERRDVDSNSGILGGCHHPLELHLVTYEKY